MSGTPVRPRLPEGVLLSYSRELRLVSEARNHGAMLATGEYLCFIDDDNEIPSDMLLRLTDTLRRYPDLVLIGPATYFLGEPTMPFSLGALHGSGWGRTRFALRGSPGRSSLLVCDAIPNIFLMRRDHFEKVGGFDEIAFPMDMEEADLALRLRTAIGGRVACDLTTCAFHDASRRVKDRLAPKGVVRGYYTGRNRAGFIGRHYGLRSLLCHLLTWYVPLFLVKLGAIFSQRDSGLRHRLRVARAFAHGTLVAPVFGLREARRKGGPTRSQGHGALRGTATWADVGRAEVSAGPDNSPAV